MFNFLTPDFLFYTVVAIIIAAGLVILHGMHDLNKDRDHKPRTKKHKKA